MKHRISFKNQIILWYTLLTILILSSTLFVVYYISSNNAKNSAIQILDLSLESTTEDIRYTSGIFNFDKISDNDDISLVIYDIYGNVLYGNAPRLFPIDSSFKQEASSLNLPNNNKYIYKDLFLDLDGAPFTIVLRAIIPYTNINTTLQYFIITSLIIGPLGLVLAIIGARSLLKLIFEPIDKIATTAQTITKESDLSLRVTQEKSSKELDQLIDIINSMLDELEISFEREKQFTDNISHELRTPLTSILLDIELLQLKETYDPKIVERIHSQIMWLSNLINNMNLSSHGLLVEKEKTINLKEFITQVKEDYPDKTIDVFINDDVSVDVDTYLLKIIINNLINNAFKYGASNVSVHYNKAKQLIIEDDGIGIAQKDINKIWDRFYQVDQSRSSEHSSGLGLYLVKEAIKSMGWKISVESEINQYTRFIIGITS